MKRIFSLLTVAIAAIAMYAQILSGTCGDNLTWTVDPVKEQLYISGTGAMNNYSPENKAPWNGLGIITHLSIGKGITTIGDYAFHGLRDIEDDVYIPEGVTRIGKYAFSACTAMTSVYIPYGVESIGDNAFGLCIALFNVEIPFGVTSIGKNAFAFCTELIDISIPATVTEIGDRTFWNCTALTTIKNFASTPPSINENVFEDVDISKCTLYVPDYAYYNYDRSVWTNFNRENEQTFYSKKLYDFGLDVSMSYDIGTLTLTGTGALPDQETGWGYMAALFGHFNITQLSLPEGLTTIGRGCFAYLQALTSVTIPEGVKNLNEGAFANCYSLSSVSIPSSTDFIANSVFHQCKNLKTIYNYATTPQDINYSEYGVFMNVEQSQCTLYVPKGSKPAYEAAPVWQDFIIEEMDGSAVEEVFDTRSSSSAQTPKVIVDGNIYIIRDGKTYSTQGIEVR